MRLRVKVKPNAKRACVRVLAENELEISVMEKPAAGKANAAVLRALAAHLGVAASRLRGAVAPLRWAKARLRLVSGASPHLKNISSPRSRLFCPSGKACRGSCALGTVPEAQRGRRTKRPEPEKGYGQFPPGLCCSSSECVQHACVVAPRPSGNWPISRAEYF